MSRGKGFSRSEDHVIKFGLETGKPVSEIAEFLGRARQSVYKRIEKLRADGKFLK